MNERSPLTHLNRKGEAHMVDIAAKNITRREAVAQGTISGRKATLDAIFAQDLKKGDALATARIAGIMGAKKTPDLIPLCHPIALNKVEVDIERVSPTSARIKALARCEGKTGVEMEALTAVSVAALALYDMAKAIDREMIISDIMLTAKSGGKSGDFARGA